MELSVATLILLGFHFLTQATWEEKKRPGIDCLRMRDDSQKNLEIRLRLETVGKISTYTSDIFPYH